MPNKLTPEDIQNMKPGIFAEGIALDNQYGINMSRTGRQLRWVAVRGGAPDWKIYCHFIEKSKEAETKYWLFTTRPEESHRQEVNDLCREIRDLTEQIKELKERAYNR